MRDEQPWLDLLRQDASVERFSELAAEPRYVGSPKMLAAALEIKSQLHERTQRAHEFSALNNIAFQLASLQRPEELLPEIVAQARRLLDVDLAYLGLRSDDSEPSLRIVVSDGELSSRMVDLHVPLSRSLAGRVMETKQPVWVSDYRASEAFEHFGATDSVAAIEGMRGLLGVPLAARERVIGALFASKRTRRRFTESEIVLLTALAAHAAMAIDNTAAIAAIETATSELTTRTAELEQAAIWSRRLTRVVLHGGNVADLLDEITALATVPVRFLREPKIPQEVRFILDLDETTLATVGERAVLARRVAASSQVFGALVMTSDQALPQDRMLLEQAAPVLALALVAQDAVIEAGRFAREATLIELLNSSVADAAVHRLAERAGLDPSDSHTLVVVDASGPTAREQVQSMAWPKGSQFAEHLGRLIVVAPDTDPTSVRTIWGSDFDLLAGVGEQVNSVAELIEQYRRTLESVRTLRAVGVSHGVRAADELGPFHVLLAEAGRARIEGAFRSRLGRVVAEGRERGIPLLETMACYLESGQRPGLTARTVGIHVNTLYQRLSLIDRILGKDWRSPATALELNLIITLMSAMKKLQGKTVDSDFADR